MKNLPLLGMTVLALAGCKEKKNEAGDSTQANAKPSKTAERPAKRREPASENLPYPEGLKLIETAEKTSSALAATLLAHKDYLRESTAEIIGGIGKPPSQTQPTPEADRAKAEIAEARKVNMAAMVAIARYEGTDFEEEQIKAFQERQRLRQQVAALEARMEAATAASDPATQESLQGVLAEAKEKLEALEAAWREVSSTGWQARVEAAGE